MAGVLRLAATLLRFEGSFELCLQLGYEILATEWAVIAGGFPKAIQVTGLPEAESKHLPPFRGWVAIRAGTVVKPFRGGRETGVDTEKRDEKRDVNFAFY